MPSAIGLQKAEPGQQVVCMAGEGGISMLFGDLMTVVQQEPFAQLRSRERKERSLNRAQA
ncbi:hypothetical protein CWO89_05565 [Bradyrhizobium sp. Leo170]|nr:hypothetical protein CWO89_05565 [Bradyrhizobium sp. Leo170]